MGTLYLRQLLAGRDFGVRDKLATAMQNFGDPEQMYRALTERLCQLPPGHAYGGEQASLEVERRTNPSLQRSSLDGFLRRNG